MPGMAASSAWVGLLALAAVLAPGVVCAAEEPRPERVIRYEQDALTLRVAKVPLPDILSELSQQSGAEIRGQLREGREVSAEFEAVPLPEALHRLLGTQNFALIYGPGGKLRTLKLLGGPIAGGVSVASTSATSSTLPGQVSPAAVLGMMDRHLPVPITGRLQQFLGSDTASMRQLLEIGLHNEDTVVRAEAIRTGLQVIEAEADLRAGVLSALNSMSEDDLTTFVRGIAGDRAEEFAMHLTTQTRVSEIRVKASSVLNRIRTGG